MFKVLFNFALFILLFNNIKFNFNFDCFLFIDDFPFLLEIFWVEFVKIFLLIILFLWLFVILSVKLPFWFDRISLFSSLFLLISFLSQPISLISEFIDWKEVVFVLLLILLNSIVILLKSVKVFFRDISFLILFVKKISFMFAFIYFFLFLIFLSFSSSS